MTRDETKNTLEDVIEINRMVVKQNALIVQMLTLPHMMVSGEKPGSWKEVPEDYFKEKNA